MPLIVVLAVLAAVGLFAGNRGTASEWREKQTTWRIEGHIEFTLYGDGWRFLNEREKKQFARRPLVAACNPSWNHSRIYFSLLNNPLSPAAVVKLIMTFSGESGVKWKLLEGNDSRARAEFHNRHKRRSGYVDIRRLKRPGGGSRLLITGGSWDPGSHREMTSMFDQTVKSVILLP